tara:strand:+ start:92939 stop:94375 length:1437 start_codon:yes stop_codon:yes gene_type:complete
MKTSFVILLLISVFCLSAKAQVVFDKTEHDFGDLESGDARYIDIHLKNKTDKEAYILSVDQPREVVYIQKKALMMPDSSNVLRFQINKKSTGRFSYDIDVFTSDKQTPTTIKLKGRIRSLPSDQNNFTACPSFGQEPAGQNPLEFTLTVRTVDKNTGERLKGSTVAIIQNGSPLGKWKTNITGQFKIKIPLGISYFYATHSGYLPAEKGAYVNFKRNLIILELEPKKEAIPEDLPEIEIPEEDTTFVVEDDHTEEEIDLSEVIEVEEDTVSSIPEEAPPSFAELDENDFSSENFKPINVVFVIDVSSSMRQEDRIELLKYSLSQLVEMLRPQDKIGLVSYSNDAQVLLKPTSGDQKEKINEIVKDIKASGLTAGGKGIKIGYRQARRNLISDGANKVIVITDGAFNRSSDDYQKYIKRNLRRKCITMSVVGIKSNERSEENMTEAAKLGKGRFVLIEKLADAQSKLKQEIRLTAFRHK